VGKLFERPIKRQLESHLEENKDLNERKFGFKKSRSTTDVVRKVMNVVEATGSGLLFTKDLCVFVALELVNAFNTAKWKRIEKSMHDKQMPQYLTAVVLSYLNN